MKNSILFFCFSLLVVLSSYGQDDAISSKTTLGFHLTQHQNDFGIGLNVSSPYFANEKIAFRVRGNLVWHQHPMTQNETTWSPYSNISLGLVGVSGKIEECIRLYGEGGIVLLFPSSDFSGESTNFGGYGLFGFEFYFYQYGNYFIELGGIGTGAKADKIPDAPIYSNGFLMNVGYRFSF